MRDGETAPAAAAGLEVSLPYHSGPGRPILQYVEHVPDADAWLYIRGEQSIRITRTPEGTGLLTYGPRRAEKRYDFASAAALDEFFDSYRQRLLRQGWTLAIVAERRHTEREVSPDDERRSQRQRARPPRQDE